MPDVTLIVPPKETTSATDMSAMPPEVPVDYYLKNFDHFLAFVLRHYAALWLPDELEVIGRFQALPKSARQLWVRLFMRKGPFFRADQIYYAEISILDVAAESLLKAGFLQENPQRDWPRQLALLKVPDLRKVFGERIDKKGRKDALIARICAQYQDDEIRTKLSAQFKCWALLHQQLFEQLQLCFFGNARQDLSEYVIVALGHIRYPKYQIHNEDRSVSARSVLHQLYLVAKASERWAETVDQACLYTVQCFAVSLQGWAVLQSYDSSVGEKGFKPIAPRLKRARARLMNRVARQLERLGDLAGAQRLYEKAFRPPGRERLVRVLAAQDNWGEALVQAELIASGRPTPEESRFLAHFKPKILRKLDKVQATVLEASAQKYSPPLKTLALSDAVSAEEARIEHRVCAVLSSSEQVVMHVENHLFRGLYGLTLWQELFMPVSDVFFNPFQRGPADQFSRDFLSARKEAISERLSSFVGHIEWCDFVRYQAEQQRGLANDWVNWQLWTPDFLEMVLGSIPWVVVQAVCWQILSNPVAWRSGMPDLLVLQQPPELNAFELLEVKGPGDTLRPNQRDWLRHFADIGVQASVLHVRIDACASQDV